MSCHNLGFDGEICLHIFFLIPLSQTKSCSLMIKKAYVTCITSETENNWLANYKRFYIKKSTTRQTITCPELAT